MSFMISRWSNHIQLVFRQSWFHLLNTQIWNNPIMIETINTVINGVTVISCWWNRVSDTLNNQAHGIKNHILSPRLVSHNAATTTPTIEIPNATPVLNK